MKITKLLFLLCLAGLGPVSLLAQKNIQQKNISTTEITANLIFVSDDRPAVETKKVKLEAFAKNIISNEVVEVSNGDLILHFDLEGEASGFFNIAIDRIYNHDLNRTFPIRPERIYGDMGSRIPAGKTNRMSITIANAADNANPLYLTGRVTIRLTVVFFDYRTVYGKLGVHVKCEDDKKYTGKIRGLSFKKGYGGQLVGGLVTAGLYGGGLLLENKAEDIYFDQYKLHKTKEAAEADYDEANKKYKTAYDLKLAGYITGGVTVAWWILQKVIVKEKKRLYNCECFDCGDDQKKDRRTSFELFDPAADPANQQVAGIGVRLNF